MSEEKQGEQQIPFDTTSWNDELAKYKGEDGIEYSTEVEWFLDNYYQHKTGFFAKLEGFLIHFREDGTSLLRMDFLTMYNESKYEKNSRSPTRIDLLYNKTMLHQHECGYDLLLFFPRIVPKVNMFDRTASAYFFGNMVLNGNRHVDQKRYSIFEEEKISDEEKYPGVKRSDTYYHVLNILIRNGAFDATHFIYSVGNPEGLIGFMRTEGKDDAWRWLDGIRRKKEELEREKNDPRKFTEVFEENFLEKVSNLVKEHGFIILISMVGGFIIAKRT